MEPRNGANSRSTPRATSNPRTTEQLILETIASNSEAIASLIQNHEAISLETEGIVSLLKDNKLSAEQLEMIIQMILSETKFSFTIRSKNPWERLVDSITNWIEAKTASVRSCPVPVENIIHSSLHLL